MAFLYVKRQYCISGFIKHESRPKRPILCLVTNESMESLRKHNDSIVTIYIESMARTPCIRIRIHGIVTRHLLSLTIHLKRWRMNNVSRGDGRRIAGPQVKSIVK